MTVAAGATVERNTFGHLPSRVATLEAYFAATGAQIDSSEEPRAYYNIKIDRIHMPPMATLHRAAGYYGTLAKPKISIARRRRIPIADADASLWRAEQLRRQAQTFQPAHAFFPLDRRAGGIDLARQRLRALKLFARPSFCNGQPQLQAQFQRTGFTLPQSSSESSSSAFDPSVWCKISSWCAIASSKSS